MQLDEAKKILNENGYKLLDEGKFGRALAAGALALGLTAGHANAIDANDIANFEKQTEQEYKNIIQNEEDFIVYKKGQNIIIEREFENVYLITTIKPDGTYYFEQYLNNKIREKDYGKIDRKLLLKVKQGKLDSPYEVATSDNSTKIIEYDDNEEIESVTLLKNGKPIKTMCADGTIIKNKYSFENDKMKDNCTGEINSIL